jgi:ABC-type multidrug transport system fused ATPase/permease subunit
MYPLIMIIKIFKKLLDSDDKTLEFILDKKSGIWSKLGLILPISFWATLFGLITPLFIKWNIDALTEGKTKIFNIDFNNTWNVVMLIIIAHVVLNMLNQLLWYFRNRIMNKLNFNTDAFLEDKFNYFLRRFDSSFLGAENNLRLVRNLQWSLGGIQDNILKIFQLMVEIPVLVIGLGAILPYLHPYLMVIMVISSILVLSLDAYKANAWRQFELIENRQSEQKNQLNWRVVWYFNNFLTNGWLNNIYEMYQVKRKTWQDTRLKQTNRNDNIGLFITAVNELTFLANSLLAAFLVITKVITIGTLSVFFYYGDKVKDFMYKVGDLIKVVIDLRFSLFRLSFLLHMQPKLDYSNIQPFKAVSGIDSIEFKNVDFAYPSFFTDEKEYLNKMQKKLGIIEDNSTWWGRNIKKHLPTSSRKDLNQELTELEEMFSKASSNKIILNQLNFKLEKGSVYGIVGYNGAGKTTLTRLIKRTLDTKNGDLLINDVNIKTIDPLIIKEYIGSLEQNSYLIDSLTVRENLIMNADRLISDDEIWEVLGELGIKDNIPSLDAIIGEGVEFSGGQAQLLEIARILLAPKPIVILDEGTNQLDAIKEDTVLRLIREKTLNSIVIFITHRMTTCMKCDEVLVIDQGKLEVRGEPTKLLNTKEDNLFKKFWNVQVQPHKDIVK